MALSWLTTTQVCDSLCAELQKTRNQILKCERELEQERQDTISSNLNDEDIQHTGEDCNACTRGIDALRSTLRLVGVMGKKVTECGPSAAI